MGATKYTDAERVTVLGLYVENVRFGEIVTRSGLDRPSVMGIMQTMYRRVQRRRDPRTYHRKQKMRRIYYAESGLPSRHA